MTRAWIVAALLFVAVPASAADLAPYLVLVGGNVADLWTTKAALDSGHAHEGNPALERQSMMPITATKIAGVSAMAGVMAWLAGHGHQTAAKVFGYVDGSAMMAVAMRNV